MYIVIFITCANKKEAKKIAERLIKEKLAACVNIVDKIESLFWWESKIDRSQEVLLVVKSKKVKLPRIINSVRVAHSYKVPEIIALPIVAGYKPYLEWINDSVTGGS
ncbi:MAG: divalent-cation tolerance protein CutA [Candidatus Omnitrophica bacterium]|nr:divalent-cation tolerance protein CutA [Candidatus Omnitrophota bacterium]